MTSVRTRSLLEDMTSKFVMSEVEFVKLYEVMMGCEVTQENNRTYNMFMNKIVHIIDLLRSNPFSSSSLENLISLSKKLKESIKLHKEIAKLVLFEMNDIEIPADPEQDEEYIDIITEKNEFKEEHYKIKCEISRRIEIMTTIQEFYSTTKNQIYEFLDKSAIDMKND